jgi:hypothetical protein
MSTTPLALFRFFSPSFPRPARGVFSRRDPKRKERKKEKERKKREQDGPNFFRGNVFFFGAPR